ncbi:MAG: hypothetical protein FWH20_10430, partial [Oscillospiraceae bacterium]|nr:hypothetical protein [Oscillospiraceae bacterium]
MFKQVQKIRKILAVITAICMVSGFALASYAIDPLSEDYQRMFGTASELINIRGEDNFCGAAIDTETLTVGESYTILIDIEILPFATGGLRLRYSSGDGSAEFPAFEHNDTNNEAHSSDTAKTDTLVANQIPAFFVADTIPEGRNMLTVNFTLGEEIADLDPLYERFIGIFGYTGEQNFKVLGIALLDAAGVIIGVAGFYDQMDI